MECLFCKIASKSIPSKVVYEDDKCIVVLDINPRSRGMCIAIPKKHYENPEDDVETSLHLFKISTFVSQAIKEALNPFFVSIAYMPSQVKHFHLNIYPYYKEEIPLIENKPKEMSEEELEEIKRRILNKLKVPKDEPKKKEPSEDIEENENIEEKKRSKEDVYWIKRSINIA